MCVCYIYMLYGARTQRAQANRSRFCGRRRWPPGRTAYLARANVNMYRIRTVYVNIYGTWIVGKGTVAKVVARTVSLPHASLPNSMEVRTELCRRRQRAQPLVLCWVVEIKPLIPFCAPADEVNAHPLVPWLISKLSEVQFDNACCEPFARYIKRLN